MSEKEPRWPDGMDAEERVRHVALTRTRPRNAGWIATEADVSRDTAVKYLKRMADRGELAVVETDDGTGYKPDPVTQLLDEVRHLAETATERELMAELDAIGDEIASWRETYGVESLTELRQSLGNEGLSTAERQERMQVADNWATDVETREAIQLALDFKDTITSIVGSTTSAGPERDPLTQEG